jgi:hydroxypyruvate isomerase
MPKFAANLSMLFTELPFLDRFEAAASAGFSGVEFLFPYDYDASDLAARLKANGLQQVLFNFRLAIGRRGNAALRSIPISPENFAKASPARFARRKFLDARRCSAWLERRLPGPIIARCERRMSTIWHSPHAPWLTRA